MCLHRMHRAHRHGRASTRYRVCGGSRRGTECHRASTADYGVADMESFELVKSRRGIVRRWGWERIDLEIRRRWTLLSEVWHGTVLLRVECG